MFLSDEQDLHTPSCKKHNIAYTVLQIHLQHNDVEKEESQRVLAEAEERSIVEKLLKYSERGYPLDTFDSRLVIQQYLKRAGRVVSRFKDNLPGKEFAYSFLKRHSRILSARMCQNIKRARAGVTRTKITEYSDHLSVELEGIPASHVINYDETNLCDDPRLEKIIAKRGCKYSERIMNHSKSSTSIMFAASGSGELLPCYVVYKAQNMYDSWTTGGPTRTRYNQNESDQEFSTHDSNSDMDPLSDLEEAFDRRYDAAEEVISLPTFNGPRISNNSAQVSVSNSVLTFQG
ncbi:hypothetical protein JTB14_017946 [Gonioctena quinquepunctata]|nr:hypothetical protein JTB14_017946 [Gonioctena quinquepunctata]